jgi:threonine/homoserine/homoserine lactone efflux protein
MVVLALIPGPGILAVVARTLAAGLRHGASTVAGVVAGDFVFITLALLGLAALSELMGGFFAAIKYLGAVYLIWLGISIALAKSSGMQVRPICEPSHLASFAAGLLTTLGNPKAILFYLSFFPAFVDLSQVSALDVSIMYAIATIAVGGVMYGYAYAAYKANRSFRMSQSGPFLRYGSGALLVGSGVFVATKG